MIQLYDVTLRDGSHANGHRYSKEAIKEYTSKLDGIGIDVIEVGHGNGCGASSLHIGRSCTTDEIMLKTARENLKKTKLGAHFIPGISMIDRDIVMALDMGVDIFRIATHCTEADLSEKSIKYVKKYGKIAYGVLMMCNMTSKEQLCKEALKMESYGADSIIFMDSAGAFMPEGVKELILYLKEFIRVPLGFHAHNNLGLAISNSLEAYTAGAEIIDGAIQGYGAGAGNTQLEILCCLFKQNNLGMSVNINELLKFSDWVRYGIAENKKGIDPICITSGCCGVFSGFALPVKKASEYYNVDAYTIFQELGRRKVVGGQEDQIIQIAKNLSLSKLNK